MTENIGKDGRLYFTYGAGAVFQLFEYGTEKPLCKITISGCILSAEEAEEYFYVIESEKGKGYHEKSESIERLEELLNAGAAEQIEAGNAVEVPLTVREVKWFFTARKSRRKKGLEAANKVLMEPTGKASAGTGKKTQSGKKKENENDVEYQALIKEQGQIEIAIAEKIAKQEEIPSELSNAYREVCEKRKALIEERLIPISLFETEYICPYCNNTGFVNENICECARAREREIKDFCAVQRVKKRLSEEWATSVPLDDESEEEEPSDEDEGGEDEEAKD